MTKESVINFIHEKGPFIFVGLLVALIVVGWATDYNTCRSDPGNVACVCQEYGPSESYQMQNTITAQDLTYCDGNVTNGFSCNVTTYADVGPMITFRWDTTPATFTQHLVALPGQCIKAKPKTLGAEKV